VRPATARRIQGRPAAFDQAKMTKGHTDLDTTRVAIGGACECCRRCILARRLMAPSRTSGRVTISHSKSWSMKRSPIWISIGKLETVAASAFWLASALPGRPCAFAARRLMIT
jgi:hypothetical protein